MPTGTAADIADAAAASTADRSFLLILRIFTDVTLPPVESYTNTYVIQRPKSELVIATKVDLWTNLKWANVSNLV